MVRAIVLLLPGLLLGCGPSGDPDEGSDGIPVLDWSDRTPSGFHRFVYPVEDCGTEIRLQPPFEVSEDGFGSADIRIPLARLDDPAVRTTVPGGPGDQKRISYAFPSLYRGEGMREWFEMGVRARTRGESRPLSELEAILPSGAPPGEPETLAGNSYYLGTLPGGRNAAVWCNGAGLPNPVCRAEIDTGVAGTRYLTIFPPSAAGRLERIVEIGDELFRPAVQACAASKSKAKKGPVPKDRP